MTPDTVSGVIAAPEILEHVPESASPSVDDVPAGVNPDELARALEILEAANALPPEHPDKVALQRATAKLYKTVKKQRRDEAKSAIQEADRAVIESTATGAPIASASSCWATPAVLNTPPCANILSSATPSLSRTCIPMLRVANTP